MEQASEKNEALRFHALSSVDLTLYGAITDMEASLREPGSLRWRAYDALGNILRVYDQMDQHDAVEDVRHFRTLVDRAVAELITLCAAATPFQADTDAPFRPLSEALDGLDDEIHLMKQAFAERKFACDCVSLRME